MSDIRHERQFVYPTPLAKLSMVQGLEDILLLPKGMRLSIQPLTAKAFDIIVGLSDI